MGKLSKDRRDIFYRRAKEEGYRARSAYKLLQLDDHFDLFTPATRRVVDLCAAPGSWSQVCRDRLVKRHSDAAAKGDDDEHGPPLIVSVDLQEMAPLDGVVTLQGDITSPSTASAILSHFDGNLADMVLCDGAPDVTGMHDLDEYIQSQLLLSALRITTALLRPGGTMVAKVFRGENAPLLYAQLQVLFRQVSCCKPASSRNSSFEAFVVCRDFIGRQPEGSGGGWGGGSFNDWAEELMRQVDAKGGMAVVPFVSCGDLTGDLDADRNYPLDEAHEFRPPVQPPLSASYLPPRAANDGKQADDDG
ncbi:unnamed protein product [Vitrella brassicaformis CCMP3155]|uniref:Putative tRNA (cytidine(32)/guanosine(34)-2'-O)-methyltransferase n=2 Tax=Vitrella brassicaformis TaxID=1169539 RepID=A0A0G4ESG6_VITBC|nr:unnamed protein product [Vitrella brassicaformis CCMP3155]|mmetsp:Transcript_14194/g.40816  ORF Transcript_14194/g.40816 Transcript_14194/m.40816 type:complete len:305 (+) Transcript_14194:74-988(+)|eukprot:CEM00626.1 unnamed protein product [Vitrella brassicaformis CCMP3155]